MTAETAFDIWFGVNIGDGWDRIYAGRFPTLEDAVTRRAQMLAEGYEWRGIAFSTQRLSRRRAIG